MLINWMLHTVSSLDYPPCRQNALYKIDVTREQEQLIQYCVETNPIFQGCWLDEEILDTHISKTCAVSLNKGSKQPINLSF